MEETIISLIKQRNDINKKLSKIESKWLIENSLSSEEFIKKYTKKQINEMTIISYFHCFEANDFNGSIICSNYDRIGFEYCDEFDRLIDVGDNTFVYYRYTDKLYTKFTHYKNNIEINISYKMPGMFGKGIVYKENLLFQQSIKTGKIKFISQVISKDDYGGFVFENSKNEVKIFTSDKETYTLYINKPKNKYAILDEPEFSSIYKGDKKIGYILHHPCVQDSWLNYDENHRLNGENGPTVILDYNFNKDLTVNKRILLLKQIMKNLGFSIDMKSIENWGNKIKR